MNREELMSQVVYLREVDKLSTRQIADTLGISRGKCLRLLARNKRGGMGAERAAERCMLEPYRSLVGEWYAACPTLKALQVWERLRARGVATSYTTVKRLTRPFRRKRAPCYHTLQFAPGEEAQVDWFVVDHPTLGRLGGFALVLSFSRFLYARLYPRMSFEFFVQGHLDAFSALGGLPLGLRYDNLRSVVTSRSPLVYNASFLAFARHYGFEIRLCNVRAGNEKGRVERAIRTIRGTFLNTAEQYLTLRAFNAGLVIWTEHKNLTEHRSTGKAPAALKQSEPLKALPAQPWLNRLVHAPKLPTKTGLLHFDSNQYSVPEHLVQSALSIHAFCERIEVYDGAGNRVAAHPRSFERGKTFISPHHRTFARLGVKGKAERIVALVSQLDPALERFVTLAECAGQDSFHTAYALFQMLRRHPRAVVRSAVQEALNQGSANVAALHTLLDGVREPMPQDAVRPQRQDLLSITYQPRSLEEYSK